MIVVKVELHSAVTGRKSLLYQTIIANDGTGDLTKGNYDVAVGRRGDADLRHIWSSSRRRARIEKYPRLSSHVLNLVARALNKAGFK